jgi:hypothetical protein
MRKYFIGISILSVFVVLVIIGGIIRTGGPFSAKNVKLDEERLNNFSEISREVNSMYAKNNKLPPNITYIDENKSSPLKLKDPETKKYYEYKILSQTSYNLCTEFSTDSFEVSKKYEDYYFYESYRYKDIPHKKGYDCVKYDINPATSKTRDEYDEYGDDEYDSYNEEIREPLPTLVLDSPENKISGFQVSPNFKWYSGSFDADIVLSDAYITTRDIRDVNEAPNSWKLFLVFNVSNRGKDQVIYPKQLATLIAERDSTGTLTYPVKYQGFNGSPLTASEIYAVFMPPDFAVGNFFEIEVGDPGKTETVNLDFTNASEVEGSFDLNKGYLL